LNRNVRLLGVAAGVRLFGAAMVYPFLSLFFYHVAGLGYAIIGGLLLLVSVLPLGVSPFGGLVTDRLGRKRVFVAGLSGEALSMLAMAASMHVNFVPGVLIGGTMAGVAGSIAQPAIQAYVADMTDISQRTMAYTWVRVGFNAGYTGGVLLGGVLVGFIGFANTAFFTTAILASGVVFIFVALERSPYDIALAKGAVPAEHREAAVRPGSMVNSIRALARDRVFLVLCLAFFFSGLVYGHWGTTFILYTNTVLLVPYAILAVGLAINGLIVIFGQIPTTKLMTGRKHTFSAILAVVMMGLSFLALGGISLVSGAALAAMFTFVVLLTIGENLGAIPSMTLPSNVAPPSEIGNYNGVVGLFNGIGSSISPAFGGLILASFTNPLLVWTILALPCIPAILIFKWLGSRIPERANTV
jgi:MFS family permease